jgi:hypothetical protein
MTPSIDITASERTSDSTELLQTIDRRKRALEEVMHVAQTVERMQQGLQAVLLMGGSTSRIPRHVLQFYRGLDVQLRGQPVKELAGLLRGLEKAIRNDLGQIMQLTMVDDAVLLAQRARKTGDPGGNAADVSRLAGDFRRRVQTAVYLRVLLQEQGARTEPLVLAVPAEQIQQQIEALESRGRQCRQQAQKDVRAIMTDIQGCLSDAAMPDGMKETLRQVQAQLQSNLRHLESGRPIDEMPFEIHTLVLQEEVVGEAAPAECDRTARREAAGVSGKADSHRTVAQRRPEAAGVKTRPGVFRSLWLWCLTPADVSWTRIRSGDYSARLRKH